MKDSITDLVKVISAQKKISELKLSDTENLKKYLFVIFLLYATGVMFYILFVEILA